MTTAVKLYEHTLARDYTEQMAAVLEARDRDRAGAEQRFRSAARGYIELLTNHMRKEDNILFTMGHRVMAE